MNRFLFLSCCFLFSFVTSATTIKVSTLDELNSANKNAKPGDIIILGNGEWKDVTIKLNCHGTVEQPILFKAEETGKVIICGNSVLKIGGSHLIIDGWYFTNGYAGKTAAINFSIDKNQLATNCRVTNTVIDNYNNPKRMDENYWITFYGKNNRLDHCSIKGKKNMGVTIAVILDDERSRENFHSIDHNYFGQRIPLASNTGEMIRVGVSQHCQFNSNTKITDNFFEQCDGETEIVSIKSGSNIVRGNVFKECQGSVVLRHGDHNIVENNLFLGNNKAGTGGVRVINKGQWVINNFFYQCKGTDFRTPLAIMNGIPNSPAFRYVQVTDAVIANNTFYDCTPISFGEGSDTERSLAPDNVLLLNNIFYNPTDSVAYNVYDKLDGFTFMGNLIPTNIQQQTAAGFTKINFTLENKFAITFPLYQAKSKSVIPDSIAVLAEAKLGHNLYQRSGFSAIDLIEQLESNAFTKTGAIWFSNTTNLLTKTPVSVNCKTTADIIKALQTPEPVLIQLTGKAYHFAEPLIISKTVILSTAKKKKIDFKTPNTESVFIIAGNGNLELKNLSVNGKNIRSRNFIASDTNGSSNHYNLSISNCTIENLSAKNGCTNLFYAYKYMVADSIIFTGNTLSNNEVNLFMMNEEKDNKGYYNAEHILIASNTIRNQTGSLINVYRGGNDESTMGPSLNLKNNVLTHCHTPLGDPFVYLYGTQHSLIENNQFTDCNKNKVLIKYEDIVRAAHLIRNNRFQSSGIIEQNKFVTIAENSIK